LADGVIWIASRSASARNDEVRVVCEQATTSRPRPEAKSPRHCEEAKGRRSNPGEGRPAVLPHGPRDDATANDAIQEEVSATWPPR
jgi:hypothetical protein